MKVKVTMNNKITKSRTKFSDEKYANIKPVMFSNRFNIHK